MVSDTLMVISFLMLYVGAFIALEALFVRLLSWVWDSGWFWLVASPAAVVILLMNLG